MEGSFNKPCRVLMTTDTVGGVWSYAMDLCRSLQPYNVHFYLVTAGAPVQPFQREEVTAISNITLFETSYQLEWMQHPWQSIDASGKWLLNLEQQLQPDLIHLNSYSYGSLHWQAPSLVVAHSDVYSWWLAVKNEYAPHSLNEYFRRVRNGLSGTDYIVAPSATMMNSIREIYDPATAGEVIYNGRSNGLYYAGEKEPFVFSMGRLWDEAKNTQLLIDAAPLINYPIRLAGENKFESDHCTMNGRNVSYLGLQSSKQISQQLSAAAIYVLPAKYEPFGLSALEAAMSGCALILGDIESLREVWGDAALYVDTDNATALAATVNSLMNDQQHLQHLAMKAGERAKRYTATAMAEKYLAVYQRLLHQEREFSHNGNLRQQVL